GEKTVTKKPAEEKVKMAQTSEKSVPEESDDYTAERLLMKEEVRGVLSRVAKAGYRQEVRDLLTKRNAKHLDDVDPKDYAALVAEAEELANG
ncbi:MAG: rRNA biogenesis protein rrp5, partial [Eubacterium sp.]|nr:rRNA biogenesis protein rrp5 [Eubacterium sp.]